MVGKLWNKQEHVPTNVLDGRATGGIDKDGGSRRREPALKGVGVRGRVLRGWEEAVVNGLWPRSEVKTTFTGRANPIEASTVPPRQASPASLDRRRACSESMLPRVVSLSSLCIWCCGRLPTQRRSIEARINSSARPRRSSPSSQASPHDGSTSKPAHEAV